MIKLLFMLSLFQVAIALNILALYPFNGKSHFTVFQVLFNELAKRGHNVTVVSPFPQKNPPHNYYDISLNEAMDHLTETLPMESYRMSNMKVTVSILSNANLRCVNLLKNGKVQRLIKEKMKFDVVLYEQLGTDCPLAVAYKLGAPTVATSTTFTLPWHFSRFGLHFSSGTTAYYGEEKLTFGVRLKTFIIHYALRMYYSWIVQSRDQKTVAKYLGNDVPPLEDLASSTKFLLSGDNSILSGSRLLPANIIEVAGYHVTEPKPLSGALHKFVEEAEEGVIFVSFGSFLKSSSMPPEKLDLILEVIHNFPQRFVWKWENTSLQSLLDKKKFYIDSWLPQIDILGHPKTVAFISHAGIASTYESLHFGVPMLCVPVTAEQPLNARKIVNIGAGQLVPYEDITKDKLVIALQTVLNPKFKERVREISRAYLDRQNSAIDTAVFWVEFAARHPTLSLRSSNADVPFYQAFLLDIIAFFIFVIFITFICIWILCGIRNRLNNRNRMRNEKFKEA